MCTNNGSNEDKITITLLFEDKETKVSWCPSETSNKDAKFMFLCACDSLIDSHFEIYDSNGALIDHNSLYHFKNNSGFFLHKAKKGTKPIANLLLDDKRKLFVEIEPLKHIEAQTAIKYICVGSNILKQTKKGIPHIKMFQLSSDLKRILWYSKSKKIEQSQIAIDSIKDITLGQISDTFQLFPIKILEEFSFSIYYFVNNNKGNKTKEIHSLDLICKNAREFDIWLIAIKALHSHYNSKIISKNDLLSHSLNYQKEIKKGNVGKCSSFLFYSNQEYTSKGKCIEKILINRDISLYTLTKRISNLCQRQLKLLEQMIKFTDDNEDKKNKDLTSGYNIEEYQELFDEEIVDDLETQKSQIGILYQKSTTCLTVALDDFFLWYNLNKNNTQAYVPQNKMLAFNEIMASIHSHYTIYLPYKHIDNKTIKEKIESDLFLKELDIRLWEIEINIENIYSIMNQLNCANNQSFLSKIKNLFN